MNKKINQYFRTFGKWLFRVMIALIVLIVLAYLFLTIPPGEAVIKNIAQRQVGKLLNEEVHIGKLETNLFSRMQLKNLSMYREVGGKKIPFVDLGSIKVEYNALNFIRGKIYFKNIALDSLHISILEDSTGIYNLPVVGGPPKKKKPPKSPGKDGIEFRLDKLSLIHSSAYYLDKTIPISSSTEGLNLKVKQESPNSFSFDGHIASGNLELQQNTIPLHRLEFIGAFVNDQVRVDSFSIQLPGLALDANVTISLDSALQTIEGKARLQGDVGPIARIFRNSIPTMFYPLKGKMNGHYEISGELSNPTVKTAIKSPGITAGEMLIREMDIQGIYENQGYVLNKMNLKLLQGDISGHGNFDFIPPLNHKFNLAISKVNLGWVLQSVFRQESPYQGVINGRISSDGPLEQIDSLRAAVKLALQNIRDKSGSLPDLTTNVTFRKAKANFQMRQDDTKILANAQLTSDSVQGNFSADIADLAPIVGLFNVQGLAGGIRTNGTIDGNLSAPIIKASFSSQNLDYMNLPVNRLQGGFVFANNNFSLAETRFEGKITEIDTLHPPFDIAGLRGGMSYSGRIRGAVPDSLQGDFSVDLSQPAYNEMKFTSGQISASLKGEDISLDHFVFRKDSLFINMDGHYFMNQTAGKFDINFSDRPLGESRVAMDSSLSPGAASEIPQTKYGAIEALFNLSDSGRWVIRSRGKRLDLHTLSLLSPSRIDLAGSMDYVFDFTGNMSKPQMNFHFGIDSLEYTQVFMDSVTGDMKIQANYFSIDSLNLYLQKHHSWMTGKVELLPSPGGNLTVTDKSFTQGKAEGKDINLKLLKPLLVKGMDVKGLSSYSLTWQGPIKKPHLKGQFRLKDGTVQVNPQTPPLQKMQVNTTVNDSLIEIKEIAGEFQKTPFQIRGKVVAENWRKFSSQIRMDVQNTNVLQESGSFTADSLILSVKMQNLDLSLFSGFIPGVKKFSGIANSSLTLSGAISDPEVNGNLNVRELAFQPALLDSPFTRGVVKINFKGKTILVDSLLLHFDQGTIFTRGDVSYERGSFAKLNMKTTLKNISFKQPNVFYVKVDSAQIDYAKKKEYYELGGTVNLGKTGVVYNVDVKTIINMLETAHTPVQRPSEIMQQTRLNIRIIQDGDFMVDNNLAKMNLNEDLTVIGNLASPNVTGRVSIKKGYVLYLDRKFDVQQGTFDFINPNKINPVINLTAQSTVKNYQEMQQTSYVITFSVTGPADQAKINLSSEPALSQTDILALLTLGATTEQLAGTSPSGEGPSTSTILENRLESLSSYTLSGMVTRRVGNLLGLQQLTIEGNIFNLNSPQTPMLIASKSISENVTITYRTSFGSLNEQSVQLNYRVSNHFSVQGQTDQQGNSSFDFTYRLKFK